MQLDIQEPTSTTLQGHPSLMAAASCRILQNPLLLALFVLYFSCTQHPIVMHGPNLNHFITGTHNYPDMVCDPSLLHKVIINFRYNEYPGTPDWSVGNGNACVCVCVCVCVCGWTCVGPIEHELVYVWCVCAVSAHQLDTN